MGFDVYGCDPKKKVDYLLFRIFGIKLIYVQYTGNHYRFCETIYNKISRFCSYVYGTIPTICDPMGIHEFAVWLSSFKAEN